MEKLARNPEKKLERTVWTTNFFRLLYPTFFNPLSDNPKNQNNIFPASFLRIPDFNKCFESSHEQEFASTFNSLRQLHKTIKHTQTIRRQQPTNCWSVFDNSVGLPLKGLKRGKFEYTSGEVSRKT